ncbi:MAG TPA: hypothetical protein VGU71_14360 [Candidatus Dormibacteraeota bacterium]|nr:hypothetical protein [Candidatus Dormibacteraeota bacterium]
MATKPGEQDIQRRSEFMVLGGALLRHQWNTWQRVVVALPMVVREPASDSTE